MAAKSPKYVYRFGGGSSEGRADMKALLGGKGANLAEMANLGLPVPPGFTISTEVCTAYNAARGAYPPSLEAQVADAMAPSRRSSARRFGDGGKSAARLRPLRRPRLHAGHDGHGAEPRPQRRDGGGPRRQAPATGASPMTATAASSDVFGRRAGRRPRRVRGHPRRLQGRSAAMRSTPRSRPRTGSGLITRYKALVAGGDGQALPAGCERHSSGAPSARCSLLERRARHHLPQAQRHSRRTGAPPSTCRPWSSATWARPRPPAWPSPATPPPATSELYGEFLVNAQGEDVVAGIRTPQNITERRASRPAPTRPRSKR